MSFFRYPGGKSKLKDQILSKLNTLIQNKNMEYREPFFGGGSIGLSFLDNTSSNSIWINDFDTGIYSLWFSVYYYPEQLKERVMAFTPTVDAFHEFKSELNTIPQFNTLEKVVNFGFKKLAIHQISYSGLGTMSGSPLGGKEQKSQYKIDCRWSPNNICTKIDKLNKKLLKFDCKITGFDFSELILDDTKNSIIYLDPPYFNKGNDLYQHGFTLKDHERLSELLRETNHRWLLSYDDCEEIQDLYSWANIEELGVNYSITALKDRETGERTSRTKTELLITSKDIKNDLETL